MQYIDKKLAMPVEVEKWLAKNDKTQWNISQKFYDGYKTLREQLRLEQHGLCCYCCQALEEKATIEHLKSRDKYPKLIYEYENLLLSCQTPNQCDNAKGNQDLDLTPLMPECVEEIVLLSDGKLEGKAPRAESAIETLNLNNDKISSNRKVKYDIIFLLKADIPLIEGITDETTVSNQVQTDQLLDEQLKLAYGETPEYYEFQYILKKIT